MPLARRKSWREKLADDKHLPRVIRVEGKAAARWGGRTIAIAAPREIDALMRSVPPGRVTTVNELRAAVARRHGADAACPITTGIFSWIAAHAAEEARAAGEAAGGLTPYWRTLKAGGELNAKFPGGIAGVRKKLAAEGHRFVQKGARTFVRDLPAALFSPSA
jgi:hypothetical protein